METVRMPVGGARFDRTFAAVCIVSILGLYFDGWAHNNGFVVEDRYDTPFHFVLVGGALASAILVVSAFLKNDAALRMQAKAPRITAGAAGDPPLSRGWTWLRSIYQRLDVALPVGYTISMIGVLVYFTSVAIDKFWHDQFGVEATVEALFSPSHLGLLLGALLLRTGPLRSAWRQPGLRGWSGLWPMVLSATFLLGSLQFFTQYVHPLGITPLASEYDPSAASAVTQQGAALMSAGRFQGGEATHYLLSVAVVSVVVQTALWIGLGLFLVGRWGAALPFGTFTLILGMNGALMVGMRELYSSAPWYALVGTAILGGLWTDFLVLSLRPPGGPARFAWLGALAKGQRALRSFAFLAPLGVTAFYVAALLASPGGVWVKAHVWVGLPVMAGGIGWIISFLVLQPPFSAPIAGGAAEQRPVAARTATGAPAD